MNDLLRFLHILTGATWLGAAMWVAGDVRRTLALGKPHLAALPARAGPAVALDLWAGVATVLIGLAYTFTYYEGHPERHVMVGLALGLVRVVFSATSLRPAWNRLAARIAAGEDVPAGDPGARRLGMLSGIGHTLWVAILVSMVWSF